MGTLSFDVRAALFGVLGIDLTQIHGLGPSLSLKLVGECGTDLRAWPSAKHFTSWLCLAPGNKISGGKILSSRTRRSSSRAAALLRLASGAPLAALQWHKEGFGAQVEQLSADLVSLSQGKLDPATAAARWVKMDAARCIEWLARRVSDVIRVRFGVASRDVAHNLRPQDLPDGLNQIKLNQMFQYLDNVHRA